MKQLLKNFVKAILPAWVPISLLIELTISFLLIFSISSGARTLEINRIRYNNPTEAAIHLKYKILNPTLPLNFLRRQAYTKFGKGKRDGMAGWEKFSTNQGTIRACIVPTSDGTDRVTIVTLFPKDKWNWSDILKSKEAFRATSLLNSDEDGKKKFQIRIDNLDKIHSMQITIIIGEEKIEQITWTLVG